MLLGLGLVLLVINGTGHHVAGKCIVETFRNLHKHDILAKDVGRNIIQVRKKGQSQTRQLLKLQVVDEITIILPRENCCLTSAVFLHSSGCGEGGGVS